MNEKIINKIAKKIEKTTNEEDRKKMIEFLQGEEIKKIILEMFEKEEK